ncbi:MAG: MaoC/PaaZ C-terminal domain-containing protein [Bacteriovoracaceae bacterium]
MKSISEISTGYVYEKSFEITNDLHRAFIQISGDDSPIHTDLAFCQRNGFDKVLGHAFLLTTLLSQIYGKHFPGGNELCLSHTTNFKKPFFISDILTFKITVTNINHSLELINTSVDVINQEHVKIFQGNGILKLSLK